MFQCHICGNTAARSELVSEVFLVEDRRVLVERIPAQICTRCGEASFSREVTEKVRRLVHGETPAAKTIPLEVFALT